METEIKKTLTPGTPYLSIKIVGHENIVAFPNTEARKINPQAPHYKSDGVAVWVNTKKEISEEQLKNA